MSQGIQVEPSRELGDEPCAVCDSPDVVQRLVPSFNAISFHDPHTGSATAAHTAPRVPVCQQCWDTRPQEVRYCAICRRWTRLRACYNCRAIDSDAQRFWISR